MKTAEHSLRRVLAFVRGAAIVSLLAAAVVVKPAAAAEPSFGKPGDPIKLVVGYQPYATITWPGAVVRGKKFYEKYLPTGSSVEFQIALQGPAIINGMASGRLQVGYLGDMPAIVAASLNDADLRLVGVSSTSRSMCSALLVRRDAPPFADAAAAAKWLNGKRVAAARGTCADRFAQSLILDRKLEPLEYKNLNGETISAYLKDGKIDAAVLWEPLAARLVLDGFARRELSGATTGDQQGAFVLMRADLITQRPDIVKAWLQAELDAQLFMLDTRNAFDVVHLLRDQTAGIPEKTLWWSLYGTYTGNSGGEKARMQLPFAFTADVTKLLREATSFLHQIKLIDTPALRANAVMPGFAEEVLKARKLSAPLGEIRTLPDSAYRGN